MPVKLVREIWLFSGQGWYNNAADGFLWENERGWAGPTMKILIADDDEANRLLLAKILQPLGVPDLVVDGQEAVEAFEWALQEGNPYDLVFLDIMMPGKDGLQVLKIVRELDRKHISPERTAVKIFMISAQGTEKNVHEAFVEGNCTDFFIKPVNKRMVLEKLADNGIVLE